MTTTAVEADLCATAAAMVRAGRGVLAADESSATCSSRLSALGIEATAASRRDYRELLLAADGLNEYVSGVILFDETFRQTANSGESFPELLRSRGILPGIKLDTGPKPLANAPDETVTEGLDGLRERIAEYEALGARFAKWRAVLTIAEGRPSRRAVVANAHALARYAALCQEGGLVPIVEPEILMAGDHDIVTAADVAHTVLVEVFVQMRAAGVDLEAIVLKPSMVTPGVDAPVQASVEQVAQATVDTLRAVAPATLSGVAFLSGGQPPAVATAHLAAMVALGPHPWPLTFSFGRAIQDDVLVAWAGQKKNTDAARAILIERVAANAKATVLRHASSASAAS